jgi:hypothetical protein
MLVRLSGMRPCLRPSIDIVERGTPGLILDAKGLKWASPADLTAIATWAAYWAAASNVRLMLPDSIDAANYIQRMDLLRCVEKVGVVVEGIAGPDERDDLGTRLIEVRQINSETDVDRFASDVHSLVTGCVGRHQAAVVHTMLGELLDNTITHARSPIGAFGAAQVYSGETTGSAGIEIAVADPGIGILQSLRQNPTHTKLPNCAAAIRASLRHGVSSEVAGHGNGLADVVRRLSDQHGILVLRSGDGLGRVTSRHRSVRPTDSTTPGTWAWLRLNPTVSPTDLQL